MRTNNCLVENVRQKHYWNRSDSGIMFVHNKQCVAILFFEEKQSKDKYYISLRQSVKVSFMI